MEDFGELVGESELEESIGFVDDEGLNIREREGHFDEQVKESTRCSDNSSKIHRIKKQVSFVRKRPCSVRAWTYTSGFPAIVSN